jgi:hypothetical protein
MTDRYSSERRPARCEDSIAEESFAVLLVLVFRASDAAAGEIE